MTLTKIVVTPQGQQEVPLTDAEIAQVNADAAAWAASQPNEAIKAQISALESTQTLRRIREAQAGTDSGWLNNLNTQIANLRGQLT